MSTGFERLLSQIISGRYKTGPWGLVPLPRRLPSLSQVRIKPDRGSAYCAGYAAVARHRERSKPVGYPFGKHSLRDMESHLKSFLDGFPVERDLIVAQAPAYAGLWHKHGTPQAGDALLRGALAFRRLWRLIEHARRRDCPACAMHSLHRGQYARRRRTCIKTTHGA